MKKNYWNMVERSKIDAIRYSNPEDAVRRYEAYIKKYPRDYEAKILYASVYITLKDFDYAYEIIKDTKNEYRNNKKVLENPDVLNYLEEIALKQEMRCYAYTNQLYNLYDSFFELSEEEKRKLGHVRFYCHSKLGYINEKDASNLMSYAKRQMNSYDENLFRDFIRTHSHDYNKDLEEQSDKIFDESFPLENIIEEVKKNLDYDKCRCTGYYTDQYIFRYDLCGRDNGVVQNYFKVLCLHGTDKILTMFPASDCERLPYVDLNYLNEVKVERPSQIDKFYKRFKRV